MPERDMSKGFFRSLGRMILLCGLLVAVCVGDVRALWESADSGTQLRARLRALPGFGEQKARIFIALLGKQLGVRPPGWEKVASPFGR